METSKGKPLLSSSPARRKGTRAVGCNEVLSMGRNFKGQLAGSASERRLRGGNSSRRGGEFTLDSAKQGVLTIEFARAVARGIGKRKDKRRLRKGESNWALTGGWGVKKNLQIIARTKGELGEGNGTEKPRKSNKMRCPARWRVPVRRKSQVFFC